MLKLRQPSRLLDELEIGASSDRSRAQMASDRARSTSEVQSAIQRALRATSAASPRRIRIAKHAGERQEGDEAEERPVHPCFRSPDLEQEIPRDQHHHADQHREGVVIEVAGLQPARADREVAACVDARCRRGRARRSPRRRRSSRGRGPAPSAGRTKSEVVELVEIPFVEEEQVDRAEGARRRGRQSRLPDVGDTRRRRCREARRRAAACRPRTARVPRRSSVSCCRQHQDRLAPELRPALADEMVEAEDSRRQTAPIASTTSGHEHHPRRFMRHDACTS